MLQIAERLLRRNPKYVSIVAPFVTCLLTILCGTGTSSTPSYLSFMMLRLKIISAGKADGGQYNRLSDGDNRQPGVGCGGFPVAMLGM